MDRDRVTSFFETVRLRNAQAVSEFYADDGKLVLTDGMQVCGRRAIQEFYGKLFSTTPPTPQIINLIAQDNQVIAELGGTVNDQPILVVDHFTFRDDGLIESLVIYSRQEKRLEPNKMDDVRTNGYFTSIRARDAKGISECFAQDGVLAFIDGSEIKGRDGVRDFYTKLLAKATPQPELKNVVSDGKYVVVELRGTLNDKPIIAIDHFTFDENGLIERLAIYSK